MSTANFTILYAVPPFKLVFTSAKMMEIDARWPKIPNFSGGSDHTLDSGAEVALRGDTTNLLTLELPLEAPHVSLITVDPDGSIAVGPGTSGHDAVLSLENFSGAVFKSGSAAAWQSGSVGAFQSGATLNMNSGSTFTVSTTEDVESGGKVRVKSGATLQVDAGGVHDMSGTENIKSGATFASKSGSTVNFEAGTTHTDASTRTVSGATTQTGTRTRSGASAYEALRLTGLPDATPTTISSVSDNDIYTVPASLSADTSYLLGTSGADNVPVTIRRPTPSGGKHAFIKDLGSNIMATLGGGATQTQSVTLIKISGTWGILAYSGVGVSGTDLGIGI